MTRLEHRVIDLRPPYMQRNLMLRYKVRWRCGVTWMRRDLSISRRRC